MSIRMIAVAIVAMAVAVVVTAWDGPVGEATASIAKSTDAPARIGDTVLLHYVGKTDDGEVFEQTNPNEPRGIEIGSRQVLPALEQALVGIRAGESREVRILSADAFGPYRDEPGMKTRMMRAALSHRLEPYVGMRLNAAVFADEAGKSQVWVVHPETNTVQRRAVETGDLIGKDSVRVESGLKAGEMVAVTAVSRLREGMEVRPVEKVEF